MRLALVFLFACAVVRADALSDLKLALAAVQTDSPLGATVAFESSRLQPDGEPGDRRMLALTIADGPDGFRVGWPRDVLIEAMSHATEQPEGGAGRRSRREAVGSLGAMDLFEYVNAAGPLSEVLGYAELVGEAPDTWKGRPARRLALKLNPPFGAQERKYIKELTAEATLWLDEDGWPLAAERRLRVKGRAFLVITFEQSESENYEFARIAGRLVTVRHEKTSQGSGGGESGGRHSVTQLDFGKPQPSSGESVSKNG